MRSVDAQRLLAAATTAAEKGADRLVAFPAHAALQPPAVPHDDGVLGAALAAAGIGIWECSLPDETLLWSAGVFDLFDLPRASVPDRARALACYTPMARADLTARRSIAIATGTGFDMDAEITTFLGRRRWLRITATVETKGGAATRIFGIKRDITQERALLERTRHLSEHDPLTGLANRLLFNQALSPPNGPRPMGRDGAWLLLVDLDGFKSINDAGGHAAGDAMLRAAAAAIETCCRPGELAARIGGDEFAVLARRSAVGVTALAGQILAAVCACAAPIPGLGPAPGPAIGASIGIAPWTGSMSGEALFQAADAALYTAKSGGRNTFRMARTA